MTLYFAYGSNMWGAQMAKRCPQSRRIGVARLRGYRWIISTRGYANVVESEDDEVEGVLFDISQSDEDSLDRHEGVASGIYSKAYLHVLHDDEEEVALVYVDSVTEEGVPKTEYVSRINSGLADANLSAIYVARHVRRFVPAP